MKYYIVRIMILLMIFIGACKAKTNSPTNTLKDMCTTIRGAKISELESFLCKDDATALNSTMKGVEKIAVFGNMAVEKIILDMVMKSIAFDDKLEYKNENITGNTATVDVFVAKTNMSQTVHMVNEAGVWKVCEDLKSKISTFLRGMDTNGSIKKVEEMIDNLR